MMAGNRESRRPTRVGPALRPPQPDNRLLLDLQDGPNERHQLGFSELG